MWLTTPSWLGWRVLGRPVASRRRRSPVLSGQICGSASERLEDRRLLSAVAIAADEPVAGDISTAASRSVEQHQGKRLRIDLSGQWSIDTPAGPLQLTIQQRGKRIRGTADLADVDLGGLLNLPIPIPIPIVIPPVAFKGTFKKLTLDIDFATQINLPIIGTPLFAITGNITAHVQLGTGLVGHLIVSVNGRQALSTDFTTPLPTLP